MLLLFLGLRLFKVGLNGGGGIGNDTLHFKLQRRLAWLICISWFLKWCTCDCQKPHNWMIYEASYAITFFCGTSSDSCCCGWILTASHWGFKVLLQLFSQVEVWTLDHCNSLILLFFCRSVVALLLCLGIIVLLHGYILDMLLAVR